MKSLCLVDLSGLWWSSWHATADAEVSAAYERTIAKVRRAISGDDFVAICCDSPPYWRKELCPEYKAQRDAPPAQAVEQFRRVKERLEADGLLLWAAKGFEADDVIAGAVQRARADDLAVTIVSSDKDLLQLVDDETCVRVFSPASERYYSEGDVEEKFGVPPRLISDSLALTGDKSDNVPGVPGVGPKNAAKMLQQFGSLGALLERFTEIENERMRGLIESHAETIKLARKLVALRTDAPINFEEIYMDREQKKLSDDVEYEEPDAPDPELDGELESAPQARAPSEPPPAAPKKSALAKVAPSEIEQSPDGGSWSLALEPGSLGSAYKLAKALYNSRLYSRFSNPEAIWAIIIRGREMGMGALTSLDNFHVIEGKPAPHAHLLIARAKVHPDCEYFQFIGGDHTYAEWETKNRRNPKPTRLKYTIEQAKRAQLVKPGSNWDKRPEEMLRKTCAVQLGRIEYPEAMQGLYALEEMGSEEAA